MLPRLARVVRIDSSPWRITHELQLDDVHNPGVWGYTDPDRKRVLLNTGHLIDVRTMKVVARTRSFSATYIDWRRSVQWTRTSPGAAIGRLREPPLVKLVLGQTNQCALLSDTLFAGASELLWKENTATGEVSEVSSKPAPWAELLKLAGMHDDE